MKYIVNPVDKIVEGYCFGCEKQCQNDCATQCGGKCKTYRK
jgi:Cys-rich peptide (Clo7bot family)